MAIAESKTQEAIDNLKRSWKNDPCWDIETTDGFEEQYDELLAYRLEQEEIWKRLEMERLEKLADSLGVPGNIALAKAIDLINGKIDDLQDLVTRHQ